MEDSYTILRIWKHTARYLKVLAAMNGESMIALIDRLVREEYTRTHIALPDKDPCNAHQVEQPT